MLDGLLAEEPIFYSPVLVIAPSWRCDAHCLHCFLPADSRKRDNFEPFVLQRVLQHLPPGVRLISITGGEPFVDAPRFLEILEKIRAVGRKAAVVTNGLWARDWPGARSLLVEARDRGLMFLALSLDRYHRPALADHDAARLLREAMRLGIRVTLKGTGLSARKLWLRLARKPGLRGMRLRRGWENLEHLGTGGNLPPDRRQSIRSMDSCPVVIQPLVQPDGHLVACCSTWMMNAKGTWLDLGDVTKSRLDDLLDRYRRSYAIAGLFVLGPLGLLRSAGISRKPGSETNCEFCLGWLRDATVVRRVEKRIRSDSCLRKEIVARVMLAERAYTDWPWCDPEGCH